MKRRRLLALLLLLLLLPFALGIAAPNSGPYITRVDAYRHYLESDDLLVVVRYNVPYATPPTETITQAYIGRLMSGSTELVSTSPYSYYNEGYGYGAYSMYLDAASAAGLWDTSLTVELRGSPTLSWTPSIPSAVTSSINWRATAGATATQALMYSHLIAYAEELSDYWSIALTSSTATGTVLSTYGETYFTNIIADLRTAVPALFSAGVTVPAYEDVEWQKAQSEAIKGTWPFDWGGMSEYFGLPSSDEIFRTLAAFIVVFLIASLIMAKTNRTDFAVLGGYGLLIVLAVPGWISPVIVAGFTFLAVLGAALVFIVGKAS